MKLFSFLTAVLLVTLLSCDSDEPTSKNQNLILLNGKTFKVDFASLIEIESGNEVFASIQLAGLNQDGSSKSLSLGLTYAAGQTLVGTYSFPQGNDRYLDDWLTVYTDASTNPILDYHLVEGTVTIESNGGDNYKVTVDFTMEEDKFFTGYYKGEFETANAQQ